MALSDAEARAKLNEKMLRFRLQMAHLKATKFRLMARLAAEAKMGEKAPEDGGAPPPEPPSSHPPTPPENS